MATPDPGWRTRFRHVPLPDSTTHFRLLEILQGEAEQHVVCELTTWPMDNAPSYYALSYTWGNQDDIACITLNGADLDVRVNCAYVLQQAYTSKASKYFWIDAICIDQGTVEEKNHQVAIMGEVYRKAAHVFACVGPSADDSHFLFDFATKERALLSEIYSHVSVTGKVMSSAWRVENPILSRRWLTLRCFFKMKAQVRERLAAAYLAFMRRPYFSRVWVRYHRMTYLRLLLTTTTSLQILQELFLAREISCVCGEDSQPFPHLLAISLLVDFWVSEQRQSWNWRFIARQFVSLLSTQSWLLRRQKACKGMDEDVRSIKPRLGCLALATGAWGPLRLAEVLDAMQHFECADARDRLYGILSLIDWSGSSVPVPDYDKDCFEVAVEVLRRFLTVNACAPTRGSSIEWAARLCEMFHVSLEQSALRDALRTRIDDRETLATIFEQYRRTGVDAVEVHQQRPFHLGDHGWRRGATTWLRPEELGVYDSHWYGVRLQSAQDVKQRSSIPEVTYLCCVKARTDDSITVIVDEHRRVFAYAPRETQPGDIYLQSRRTALFRLEPLAVILRNVTDGCYKVVGQAFLSYKCSPWACLTLRCEIFRPRWHPEDLILLHWTHINRAASAKSREEMARWLQLRVCGSEEPLHVQGPLPGFDHMMSPPSRYTRRATWKAPMTSKYSDDEDLIFFDDSGT
tara:strand:+ start:3620 stop:5680 length:2061 start_codon:yes stop_codon:yes gene_type:complete